MGSEEEYDDEDSEYLDKQEHEYEDDDQGDEGISRDGKVTNMMWASTALRHFAGYTGKNCQRKHPTHRPPPQRLNYSQRRYLMQLAIDNGIWEPPSDNSDCDDSDDGCLDPSDIDYKPPPDDPRIANVDVMIKTNSSTFRGDTPTTTTRVEVTVEDDGCTVM